ncbi:MAG: DUF1456 family protein [Saprospiraceae bacterium]|nr:DUF1456 family protein [Bacteroidia bacterium]NNE13982.1 DUF1456 family protein [Saprospiraceae bacterium]NNL92758.1 DUF1456 family protein [Saprospiraceae bacterium]
MNNNDIIRRIRYIFDLSDDTMIKIFESAEYQTTRSEVSDWLKKDDDPDQIKLHDIKLATFLNGFINHKRGKREGEQPKPEKRLTNNLILRKLKIALAYKDIDMLKAFEAAEFEISKHEISAFFRKPTQRQYRECKDQFLRNFLFGLQKIYRED